MGSGFQRASHEAPGPTDVQQEWSQHHDADMPRANTDVVTRWSRTRNNPRRLGTTNVGGHEKVPIGGHETAH